MAHRALPVPPTPRRTRFQSSRPESVAKFQALGNKAQTDRAVAGPERNPPADPKEHTNELWLSEALGPCTSTTRFSAPPDSQRPGADGLLNSHRPGLALRTLKDGKLLGMGGICFHGGQFVLQGLHVLGKLTPSSSRVWGKTADSAGRGRERGGWEGQAYSPQLVA